MSPNAPPPSMNPANNRSAPKQGTQELPSRPGSAASVASSRASFRIPGIQALAPNASRQSTPSDPSFVLPASYVRLFTPDTDAQATSQSRTLHMPSRQNVDWLNTRSAPPPREFLERSQTPRELPRPLQADQRPHNQGQNAAPEVLRQSGPPDEPLRPFTASSYHRSRLVTADGSSGNYICAVLENRGIGREVGIASLERDTGMCVITQFADTPTYVRTIHHMSLYPPSVLLVPASGVAFRTGPSSASSSRASKRIKIRDQGASEPDLEDAPTSDYRNGTSVLIRCLEELFDIQASPIPRRSWDYQEGARYLDRLLVDDIDQANEAKEIDHRLSSRDRQIAPLASQESERPASSRPQTGLASLDSSAKASTRAAILVAVADKYFLLSAVAALFDFFTQSLNRVFTPRSLRIQFVVPEGTILINSNTAHDLELVRNLINPGSKDCLYGLLDHCATPMGRRLLKMNILQPMRDLEAIAVRQDAVAECIRDEERFYAIRQSLKPIRDGGIDLDKLINALSCRERRVATPRSETERKVGSILSLRTLIRSLSSARAALQNASSGLFQAVQVFLDAEELDLIAEAIYQTIDDDIIHAKGGLSSRNAKLYAVRAEKSPLLDVARETYKENINDILQLCEAESQETGLSITLKMVHTGFLFQTKCERSRIKNLPERFTNVTPAKTGNTITMLTLTLKKLNARLVESMNEVLTMSDTIIDELIEEIIGKVASLYKVGMTLASPPSSLLVLTDWRCAKCDGQVSEALSLLDMVVSFANVSIANNYVRPAFGDSLDIRSARHPILDRVDVPASASSAIFTRRRRAFVPNDICLGAGERVCLITGPNMSGKSTFLRQIALITVLAGIGCFVPATRATLPIPDAILSLLTHEDDATQNLSTFATEMRTSAFILSVGSPRSLVILDEMGRGTSPDEGSAVATAIVEQLLNDKGSTVFFATHFGELVDGFDGKEGVVCQHLHVSTVQQRQDVSLVFHHKLHRGIGLDTHYSLQVAKMMRCFGDGFLQHAQQIAEAEQASYASRAREVSPDTRARRTMLRKIVRDLRRLLHESRTEAAGEDEGPEQEGEAHEQQAESLAQKLTLLRLNAATDLASTFAE